MPAQGASDAAHYSHPYGRLEPSIVGSSIRMQRLGSLEQDTSTERVHLGSSCMHRGVPIEKVSVYKVFARSSTQSTGVVERDAAFIALVEETSNGLVASAYPEGPCLCSIPSREYKFKNAIKIQKIQKRHKNSDHRAGFLLLLFCHETSPLLDLV